MPYENIQRLVEECETLEDVFTRARKLYALPFKTGIDGFSIMKAQKDYALIRIPSDPYDESVRGIEEAIYPYGSSVVYLTSNSHLKWNEVGV